MKKIIFTAYNMDVGGIERALLTLLNTIDYSHNDVTLILEKKEGIFLNEIPKKVKVKEYRISECKIIPLRKIINRLKLIMTIILNHNKYDFSCCYAPYSIPGSILTRYLSKNNSIWIHSDYYYLYNKNNDKIKKFFNERYIEKYGHIVFVSDEAMKNFIKFFPSLEGKSLICNNLINENDIVNKSLEKIKEERPDRKLFINIARHEENAKKIIRIIEAAKLLKDNNYDFEIWLIGNGPDTKMYDELIRKLKLDKNIKLLGTKNNPYPYYRLADAFILTSDYEGFPMVYLESLIFDVPLITTIDISIMNSKIQDNYGLIAQKDTNDIFAKMKKFLDEGFSIEKHFDVANYNKKVTNKLDNMFNDRW